jgi:hypothetical protein
MIDTGADLEVHNQLKLGAADFELESARLSPNLLYFAVLTAIPGLIDAALL